MQNPSLKNAFIAAAAGGLIACGAGPAFAKAAPHPGRAKAPPPVAERVFRDGETKAACVQKITAAAGDALGYNGVRTMRRAAALAQILEREGRNPAAVAAIALASYQVGVDFDLMVMKAVIESRLGDYDAPILGGSARGLFQYMPSPFSTLFSWFGAEFQNGFYAQIAPLVKFDDQKNTYTDDPELLMKILALRSDPYVAAFIKAREIRNDERPLMRAVLGREPTLTDFYAAHFLGLERAKTFFRLLRQNPKAPAADIFEKESSDPNNRPLFYSKGKKRSVRQVYDHLAALVGAVMTKIDRKIQAELRADGCIRPLSLTPPARETIAVPRIVLPSLALPPEKPREDRPLEPEAILNPVPAPDPQADPALRDQPGPGVPGAAPPDLVPPGL